MGAGLKARSRRGVTVAGLTAPVVLSLFLATLSVLSGGCGSSAPRGELGAEGDFLHGKQLYEQGRYLQAIEVLDAFRNEHPGSDRVDDAIFLLGMAHQKAGENLLARDEFDRLLRDFPQSEHREEAQFERAMAWLADARSPALDPEPLQEALDAFHAYQRNYPDGGHVAEAEKYVRLCLERLAAKAYLNGWQYLRLHQPAAARVYFEKSLVILPDSKRAGDAMNGLGRAFEMENKVDQAREAYQKLLDYATPERVQSDAHLRELRERAERVLSRLSISEARSG
jgi:outer membrane assembly lipoprotein YfiO